MPNDTQISNRFSEISKFISDAQNWSQADPSLDSHFAAYACVLLSGAIEASVERIIDLKMQTVGDRETANYVIKVLGERFRNPHWGTISGLLGEFSPTYRDSWTNQFPHTGKTRDSLESINTVKNSLAHTGISSRHVTLLDVRSYLNDVLPAIDHLEQLMVPSSVSSPYP